MPKYFGINGQIGEIPDNNVQAFLSKYPDAKPYAAFTVGSDTGYIPMENVDAFVQKYPQAQRLDVGPDMSLISPHQAVPTPGVQTMHGFVPEATQEQRTQKPYAIVDGVPMTKEEYHKSGRGRGSIAQEYLKWREQMDRGKDPNAVVENALKNATELPLVPLDLLAGIVSGNPVETAAEFAKAPIQAWSDLIEGTGLPSATAQVLNAMGVLPEHYTKALEISKKQKQEHIAKNPVFTVLMALGLAKGLSPKSIDVVASKLSRGKKISEIKSEVVKEIKPEETKKYESWWDEPETQAQLNALRELERNTQKEPAVIKKENVVEGNPVKVDEGTIKQKPAIIYETGPKTKGGKVIIEHDKEVLAERFGKDVEPKEIKSKSKAKVPKRQKETGTVRTKNVAKKVTRKPISEKGKTFRRPATNAKTVNGWIKVQGGIKKSDLEMYGIDDTNTKMLIGKNAADDLGARAVEEGVIPKPPKDMPLSDWLMENRGKKAYTAEKELTDKDIYTSPEYIEHTYNELGKRGALGDDITIDKFGEMLKKNKEPERVHTGDLEVGDEFTIAGEKFKVTKQVGDELELKDGVTKRVPDTFYNITIDKGSLNKAKVNIPEFGKSNTTEDALELGNKLKGDKEAISELKQKESKLKKLFDAEKDPQEKVYIAHQKQLYREAREVAEGTMPGNIPGIEKAPAKEVPKNKEIELYNEKVKQGQAPSVGKTLTPEERAAAIEKQKAKLKQTGQNDLFGSSPGQGQKDLFKSEKSGKDFAKGIIKEVWDGLGEQSVSSNLGGVTEAVYNRVSKFLKENELKLTREERDALIKTATRLVKTKTMSAAERQAKLEKYLERFGIKEPPEVTTKAATKVLPDKTNTANDKLLKALKEAKPLRGKQERIYTAERKKRLARYLEKGETVSGEKGFYSQKSKLRGEMAKVEFESFRDKIDQKDIDNLFDQIKNTDKLSEFDKISAGNGLAKIFGEAGGVVPQKGEIAKLEKVFGEELTKELLDKRSWFKILKENALEIANIPRSVMASFDLSFGFRQGLFVAARHPKMFFKAFAKQFKLFGSEKYYQESLKEIHSRPNYELMQKSGLSLTELGDISGREEAFMSNFAEKINLPTGPKGARFSKGIGPGMVVRASGRAYTGMADRLRADLFDYMVEYGSKFGKENDAAYLKSAADFINTATGRGSLGRLEKIAPELNTLFFSPRLLSSRLKSVNPVYYVKLDPVVRREALKNLFATAGMALTVGTLAKMNGADVELDPRNADFMKLKFGNTRYDILGGFQQPIRAAAQIITGKIISSTTGKVMTLGEGYKPLTRLDIATRFFEMKEAPLMSYATGLMRGTNAIGAKFDVPTETANRFVPMVLQDMNDLYNENGESGVSMGIPAIFGVGVQTYGGVSTWGLNGKDYPALNKELLRLKTTMGFPSSSAFGYEFTLDEYKKNKEVAGKRIATGLTRLISTKNWAKIPDYKKVILISKYVDIIKQSAKLNLFPEKKIRALFKSALIKQGVDYNNLETELDKIWNKLKTRSGGKK